MCPLPVQPSRPSPLHFAAQQTQADQLRRPRSPSPLFLSFHPLTAMAHVSAASSLSSSFLCPASDAAAPGDLRCSRARGMDACPSIWPARRGGGARARPRVGPGPGTGIPLLPRAARPRIEAGAEEAGAASAARLVRARAVWGFRLEVCGIGLQR
jgi:hypothetical protein